MNLDVFDQELSLTGASFVKRVHELQQFLQSNCPEDQKIDPPIQHYFAHGTYVREMFSPKGSVIVGKTHRYDHVCVVLKGKAMVYSEQGNFEVEAPCTFVAPKGVKRLFVVLEDLLFSVIHSTHLTDLDAIEREFIVPDQDIEQFRKEHGLEV